MESKKRTKRGMRPFGRGRMSLEEYLKFVEALNVSHLSINYLNQIICVHGFKKMHKTARDVVIDAVNTLDPIDPSRSTLSENISSGAFLGLEEVIHDLKELSWQECCVTSMQTVNASNECFSSPNQNTIVVPVAAKSSKGSNRKPKDKAVKAPKSKSIAPACNDNGESGITSSSFASVDDAFKQTASKFKRSGSKRKREKNLHEIIVNA